MDSAVIYYLRSYPAMLRHFFSYLKQQVHKR